MNTLLIFVKYPEPGKVKTRLGADIGNHLASEFYSLFVKYTLQIAKKSNCQRRILYFEPAAEESEFKKIAPEGFELLAQPEGDLGSRLKYGFERSFFTGGSKVVALGTDSPTLPLEYLNSAWLELGNHDVTLGRASDGGYYLIGLNRYIEGLFEDVKWSSDSVLKNTISIARKANLSYKVLPEWYDVDNLETLRQAARDDFWGPIKALFRKRLSRIS